MNPLYSAPITLVRYKNGTLLKLMASTYEFVSYDYYNTDGTKKDNPNFSPDAITITARLEGDIQLGEWYYSFDGTNWIDVSTKTYTETGITTNTNMLILDATSPLFAENNSYITIKAESNEPLQANRYYDTVTIARTVDPIVTYSNLSTQIIQNKESIALIASSEQLQHFSEQSTVVTKLTEVEVESNEFKALVTSSYATQSYVTDQTGSTLNAAKKYTESQLSAQETEILAAVSNEYATKASVATTFTGDTTHYLATSASSGVTTETPGWTTAPQAVTATNKYLWIYHTYTYTNSPDKDTTPYIAGVYGDQGQTGETGQTGPAGVGIQEVVPLYYASSQIAPPSKPQAYVNNTNVDYNVWTRAIPPIVGDYNYLFTCDQVTDTNGNTTWTTVVTDAAVVSMSTRLSAAELKITDEAIISTVKKEYGEVSDEGKNLLVDTNAPTLTPVDDPDIRRTLSSSWDTQSTQSTLDRSWGTIPTTLKNIPAGVEYGVFISSDNSRFIQITHADDVQIEWKSDTKSVIDFRPGAIYTISVYAAIANLDADQLYNRLNKPKINVFLNGHTSGGTMGNITEFSWVFPEGTKAGEVVKLAYTVHMPTSSPYYAGNQFIKIRTDIEKDLINIYLMGFKVENGYQATDWNDGTPALATNTSVESQIYQSADEIRMKADKISWESTYSSMSEDGYLECTRAFMGQNSNRYNVYIIDGTIIDNVIPPDASSQVRQSHSYFDFSGLYHIDPDIIPAEGEEYKYGPYIHSIDQFTVDAIDVNIQSENIKVVDKYNITTNTYDLDYYVGADAATVLLPTQITNGAITQYIRAKLINGIICNPNAERHAHVIVGE